MKSAFNKISSGFRSFCIQATVPMMAAAMVPAAQAEDANDMIETGSDLITNIMILLGSAAQLIGGWILISLLMKMWRGEREGGDSGATTGKKWVAGLALVAIPQFIDMSVTTFFSSGSGGEAFGN